MFRVSLALTRVLNCGVPFSRKKESTDYSTNMFKFVPPTSSPIKWDLVKKEQSDAHHGCARQ